MEITELGVQGCYLIKPRVFSDMRGSFVKSMVASKLRELGLRTDFVEQYYSTSASGVVRGMHFQQPPHDHCKLVYCVSGAVTDVILDIRRRSATYGQHLALPLNAEQGHALYLPIGIAHGFVATNEPALMVYNVTSEYAPDHDAGIRWDSFGFDWGLDKPVMSERDRTFPELADFDSPF